MSGNFQTLREAIDRLENLSMILRMPLPSTQHVEQLRAALPELISELKGAYVEATSENPWQNWEEKRE